MNVSMIILIIVFFIPVVVMVITIYTKYFFFKKAIQNDDIIDLCGEWQYSPQENIAICSCCMYEHYLGTYHQYATKYCPNCGKKMKPIK